MNENRFPDFRRNIAYIILPVFIWMIYLLSFYPGLMSVDSINQWGQVVNFKFIDVHPVFHTFINWIVTRFWFSPAAIVIFQILYLSIILSFFMLFFEDVGVSRKKVILLNVLIAVVPVNGMLAISLWKDIPYTATFLWLILLMLYIVVSKGKWLNSKRNNIIFAIVLLFLTLFRHNGIIPATFSLLVLMVFFQNIRKNVLKISLCFFCLFLFIKIPLYNFLGVAYSQGNLIMGIPLHQIGSILHETNKKTISLNDKKNEWSFQANYPGYKLVGALVGTLKEYEQGKVKQDNQYLEFSNGSYTKGQQFTFYQGKLYITLSNKDTGWEDSYLPSKEEIQSYLSQHGYVFQYSPSELEINRIALSKDDTNFLNELMPLNSWNNQYNAYYNYVILNNEFDRKRVLPENRKRVIGIWFKLVKRYPDLALNEFKKINSLIWQVKQPDDGYIYPHEWEIVKNEYGLKTEAKSQFLQQNLKSIIMLTERPGFNWLFWRPALFLYILILTFLWVLFKINVKLLALLTPIAFDVAGLSITIPAQDIRYMYPLIVFSLVSLGFLFIPKSFAEKFNEKIN